MTAENRNNEPNTDPVMTAENRDEGERVECACPNCVQPRQGEEPYCSRCERLRCSVARPECQPESVADGGDAKRFTFPICDICGESTYTCRCDHPENLPPAHPEHFVLASQLQAAEKRAEEAVKELSFEKDLKFRAEARAEFAEKRAEEAKAERDRTRWHLAIFIAPIERLVAGLRPYLGDVVEQVIPALEKARAAIDKRILDEARAALDDAVREDQP